MFFVIFSFPGFVLSHNGHSEEYRIFLNQPKPSWLRVGKPIKAEMVEEDLASVSKGGTEVIVFTKKIVIPSKKIELVTDERILGGTSWGSEGSGFLSPDGRLLLVNGADVVRMYEIGGEGRYREIGVQLPLVTFDSLDRGTIGAWRWVSDDVLLAEAEVEDKDTGEHSNSRIYAYNLKDRILVRVDFDSLNEVLSKGLELKSVNRDSKQIGLSSGGKTYFFRADFSSSFDVVMEKGLSRGPFDPELASSKRSFYPAPIGEGKTRKGAYQKFQSLKKLFVVTAVVCVILLLLYRYSSCDRRD
ncbi:MAG: hypothetical protein AAF558_00185 [Verrucomicrobiota bacterium]